MQNPEHKHHWTFRHQLINRIIVLSEPLGLKAINITSLGTVETAQLVALGKTICNLHEELYNAGLMENTGFTSGDDWKEFDAV